MKDIILKALKRPYIHSVRDINKITNISKSEIQTILDELLESKLVYKKDKNFYIMKEGIIQIKDKGFGFIKVEGEESDYYVNEFNTQGASTGDKVSFYVLPKTVNDFLDNACVIDILERKNTHVYGRLVLRKNKKGISYFVQSYDKDYNVKCYIKEDNINDAKDGAIVSAKITKYISIDKVEGYVEKIIGYEDDPGIDISVIAEKYSFFKDFPSEVIEELKSIPDKLESFDKSRKDFRDKQIITIDGDDSKDFDDAINVEILDNGNFYLGVFIADVSEYVKENAPLDKEALYRGTSVYLADRVIPMLPRKLSNGICSLNEGEDRLVLACEMEFNSKGKLVNYSISEGVIRSCHRMTYNNVNKMLDGDKCIINKYQDIYPMILNAYKLSKIIRSIRTKKGAIDFEVPEYKVILDKNGDPIDFILRDRDKAEMMIEDFMLSANETVAYHMSISNLPCAYRIHDTPNVENVTKVFELINDLGYKVVLPRNKILPSVIQKTMNMMKESDKFFVINQLMLRSMAKAKYSEKNAGHYGLAMEYYCHFTSPIRRYPDLMVHRIIKELIIHNDNFEEKYNNFTSNIHEICNHSSIKEREAIECEREVVDMLMASYMEDKIGQELEGRIQSITKFGMFVLLDNGVEGLVHITNMDGYYTFNEKNMALESASKTFHIGDKVNIVVIEASKKTKRIDFMLKDDYYQMWRV